MFKKEKQKGITLISLVITIIILLILAAVAINLAIDSNGLFAKAGDAANKWNSSVAAEGTALNDLMTQMDEITTPKSKTLVQLYDEGELKIGDYVNYNPIAKGDTGTEKKYTYTSLGENSEMAESSSGGSVSSVKVVKVASAGDDGGDSSAEDQSYTVNTETKWRVLGVEGTGAARHILLISADPIRNVGEETNYYWMKGAKAYLNCITELTNISSIYGHGEGATGARSVNINDINKITGVTVSETEITPDVDQEGVYGTPYSFNDHYTPESWVNGQTTTTVSGTCNGYWYEGNAEGLQTNETTNPETGARLYEMLFADTGSKYYWLASRGVGAVSDYAFFGPGDVYDGEADSCFGLFGSDDGNEYAYGGGVRPVVSLESGVTEETIHKISDQEREDWGSTGR